MVELGYDSYRDFLDYFYPSKTIPTHTIELCNNIDNSINIMANENGPFISNSLNDTLEYLNKKGYAANSIDYFVIRYKDELLNFNNKAFKDGNN